MKRMGLNVAAEGISLGYAYTFLAQSWNLACMINQRGRPYHSQEEFK